MKALDLTGKKFGRLTVIERVENRKGRWFYKCQCECGNITVVSGNALTQGHTRSCGCTRIKSIIEKSTTHGMSKTKIYGVWSAIKARCLNSLNKAYKNYGERGITMYPAWINDFQAFYDYVSKLPHFDEEGYSLDRIDNDGNYEPNNIRWADRKTQSRNRRNRIIVEYNGEKMTLGEAAEKSNVEFGTLKHRLKRGETGEYLFRLPR